MRSWLCALAFAAISCTDDGYVGRLHAPPAAGAAGQAADSSAAPSALACSLPPCSVLPCDTADPLCLWCGSDSDCADEKDDHFCERRTGVCMQCLKDSQCPASAPYCHGGKCAACDDNDDCGDGQECKDGKCLPDS